MTHQYGVFSGGPRSSGTLVMKVFWLLFVFLPSQSEALQRLNRFAKNWRSQIRDEYLQRDLNPRNTIWRLKPKVTKNVFGLKPQGMFHVTLVRTMKASGF